MIVRRMNTQELDSTLILLEYLRDEAQVENYNQDYVLGTVRDYNIKADHMWYNAYEGGRPVGCIGAYLYEDNYGGNIHAHIQYLYVLPSHRNKGVTKDLVQYVEDWAKSMNAQTLTASSFEVNYFNEQLNSLDMKPEAHMIKDL